MFLGVRVLAAGWLAATTCLAARSDDTERGRPFLEVFAPGDYHGHQQVFDVAQSSTGLVYFSNFGALREYDGAKWRAVAVPTTWIRKLATDNAGRVWLGGVDELGWCEPGADGVTTYHSLMDRLPAVARPLGAVWTVQAKEDSIWFATDHQVLRWRNGKFQRWAYPDSPAQRLRDGGEHLWLSRRGDGLYRWNGKEWEVVSRAPEVTEQMVNFVIEGWKDGSTLIGTSAGRLWALGRDGVVREPSIKLPGNGLRLTSGTRLRNGLIAITTQGDGVWVFDGEGRLVERLGFEEGLPSSSTYSATEDREGGVWIGTSMGGARVELGSAYTFFDRENGRGATVALSLYRNKGALYIGSEEGVRRLIPAEGAKARFEALADNRRTFCFLPYDDSLLAGTDGGLARIVDGRLQREIQTPVPMLGLGRSISAPERIFAGLPETIVTYRHSPAGEWINEGSIAGFSGEARTLIETANDCLWVGTTQRGFARIRRAAGQTWQSASVEYFSSGRGLPADPGWVRVLAGPGGPWFSTAQGLFLFDVVHERFEPAPAFVATKMTGLYTFPVAVAKEGEIWAQVAASAEDADLERPSVGRMVQDAAKTWSWQPLPERIIKQVGYFGVYEMLAEPGVLWLSGQSSIVRIETDRLTPSKSSPAPLIWRQIERSDVGAVALGTAPVLPFSNLPLRAEFARPRFSAGRSAEFSYRLHGFNERWSNWRTQPEIELTGLPAGHFVLEVRSNDAPNAGPTPLSFAFTIRPPWYAAPISYVLYALVGLGSIAGMLRWRLAALHRNQARLEALVAVRTRELTEASERAETANRAKTLFLANISHELRTPLHAILGYSQLLEMDRTIGEQMRARLRVIGTSGRHLLRLINDVLDLSKIESGKQELRVETFSLVSLLAEVIDAPEARAKAKGLSFGRPNVSELPDNVSGDSSKLRQVLENLLGNAVKFTVTGEVALSATAIGAGRIRFAVSDTGPGIPKTELPRLFQPFHRAADRSASPQQGTGLGLAITRRLVALMGGEVLVASEFGHGSCFWFDLHLPPVAGSSAAATTAASTKRFVHGQGRRILVVDDIAVTRDLLYDLLQPLGFLIERVATAEEALTALARMPVDLLILDLRLPGMSGQELARRVRREELMPGLKILAASASALKQDPEEALLAGCDDFIAKPFLVEELIHRVSRLLAPDGTEATVSEVPAPASSLNRSILERLHTAAQEGDVMRLRGEIERLRAAGAVGPVLDEIEQRTSIFDVDGVVAVTSAYLQGTADESKIS